MGSKTIVGWLIGLPAAVVRIWFRTASRTSMTTVQTGQGFLIDEHPESVTPVHPPPATTISPEAVTPVHRQPDTSSGVQSLRDLMRIRAHNREYLDSLNGKLGTALGFKKQSGQPVGNRPAIIVFVPQKINPKWFPAAELIPDRLEGPDGMWCWLDVVEGGKAEAEREVAPAVDELAARFRGWDDRVWTGSQVFHWVDMEKGSFSMGTLGAFARDRNTGNLGFLTNQHVGIGPLKQLFHPVPWGTHLGTTVRTVDCVEDELWYGPFVDEPFSWIRADGAFVALPDGFDRSNINPDPMGIGQLGPVKPTSLGDMSIIGQPVKQVGRTTDLRTGKVSDFGYEWFDGAHTYYTDFLIVGDDGVPFSTHGDSGSLIVTNDSQLNPIGLLWGGWQEKLRTGYAQENWTYGTSITRILDALGIDLVTSV